MSKPVSRIIEHFPLLSPSLQIAEARKKLHEAEQYQAINIGYGVVVNDAGFPLTCLNTTSLETWPVNLTLGEMQYAWPVLLTHPRREVTASDRDIYLLARFYQEEWSEHSNFVGIILLDERGRPNGIVRKRILRDETDRLSLKGKIQADIPAEGDLIVKRYGHLNFPRQVQLNSSCQLVITINREPLANDTPWELGLKNGDWPLKVTATLLDRNKENFIIVGSMSGIIEVPRTEDSQPITFTLTPKRLGKKEIYVSFEQNNTYLTIATVHTEVVDATVEHIEAAQVQHAPQLYEVGEPPVMTIYITALESLQGLSYGVYVRTANDAPGSELRQIDRIVFPGPPDTYLDKLFEDLNKKTKTDSTPVEEYDEEVKKIGWYLFETLFHDDPKNPARRFKNFYWQEMHTLDEGTPVQIISEEPYIPWEILRPTRKEHNDQTDGAEPFLCQRFALSRWLMGPPCPSHVTLRRVALVAPPSDLQWVQPEVDAITQMKGVEITIIKYKQQLEQFLKQGNADIVHFACHGNYQSKDPSRSVVILGNRSFHPKDLVGVYRDFGRTRPLVFLNACDSGREGIGLAGLDGWATAFLESNVGFFIGAAWKITDRLACKFAITFYAWLQQGHTVGEAVRAARDAVRVAGDATYLSYTVYANPLARHRGH